MTNPDSLQAICAELRDVAKQCHDAGNFPLGEVYDEFVVRLERLDAEMREEVWEMSLCDYTTHCLHPDILYRFTVDPDCMHCAHCDRQQRSEDCPLGCKWCVQDELRARLAACEKDAERYQYLRRDLSDHDRERVHCSLEVHQQVDEGGDEPWHCWTLYGSALDVQVDMAIADLTPTAHPDVPVNLCTICGALVPVAESAEHCAGHSKQLVSNQK